MLNIIIHFVYILLFIYNISIIFKKNLIYIIYITKNSKNKTILNNTNIIKNNRIKSNIFKLYIKLTKTTNIFI